MAHTRVAPFAPFSGKPEIHLPAAHGASPGKPILLRIPATGERPMTFSAPVLPEGLSMDGQVISGTIGAPGLYEARVRAENALGSDEVSFVFEIGEGKLLLSPLLGFTSWNAYGSSVTQADMEHAARRLTELGVTEYGYAYINTDSSWQGEYGGPYDALLANAKFPDMKGMCDAIHALGLKAGIYSTPMLQAWGCPKDRPFLHGCTLGEADIRFPEMNTGIGVDRREANCVRQWEAWGFDYLKYDWDPCDAWNAEEMRRPLSAAARDFAFCITVRALPCYARYWRTYANSYRFNPDCNGTWDRMMEIYDSYEVFRRNIVRGHYFDLDMLDVGAVTVPHVHSRLSDDEAVFAVTMRAAFSSPIQISCDPDQVSDFDLSLFCNPEVIAIHQSFGDAAAYPVLREDADGLRVDVWRRDLPDGSYILAVFNRGEKAAATPLPLDAPCRVRDVWAREDLAADRVPAAETVPHGAMLYRCYPSA